MDIGNLIEGKALTAALARDGEGLSNWLQQLNNHELVEFGDVIDTISIRIDLILASREYESRSQL